MTDWWDSREGEAVNADDLKKKMHEMYDACSRGAGSSPDLVYVSKCVGIEMGDNRVQRAMNAVAVEYGQAVADMCVVRYLFGELSLIFIGDDDEWAMVFDRNKLVRGLVFSEEGHEDD